jgi:peroxiredoxin Q/BCP
MTLPDADPPVDFPRKVSLPKILWVIPVAAVLIVSAVLWRQFHGPLWVVQGTGNLLTRPAPSIVLQDQNSEIVRTSRYLGRRKLMVVFFNGERGPENSRLLLLLREGYPEIQAAGAEVVAVSTATPYRNRQAIEAAGSFPFPLLSDVDFSVQNEWGVLAENLKEPKPSLFLIDSHGTVRWEQIGEETPISLDTLLAELSRLP